MKKALNVEIDLDELVNECAHTDRDEVMDLILKMDLAVAEVEFTEKLIEKLQESLKE